MKRILATLVAILAAMVLTISPAMAEEAVGAFPACFHIGTDLIGALSFDVQLVFSAPQGKVSGEGKITAPVSPPLDIKTKLEGEYTTEYGITKVKATGYPEFDCPPGAGICPVILPNVGLQMSLNNFETGTASYKYRESDMGEFIPVGSVPVKPVPCFE